MEPLSLESNTERNGMKITIKKNDWRASMQQRGSGIYTSGADIVSGASDARQALLGIRIRRNFQMKKMPSRDTTGNCKGECRDRVFEGEKDRQHQINASKTRYSSPAENSPSWSRDRKDPPGSLGGRV
jgi:hypothetical protein